MISLAPPDSLYGIDMRVGASPKKRRLRHSPLLSGAVVRWSLPRGADVIFSGQFRLTHAANCVVMVAAERFLSAASRAPTPKGATVISRRARAGPRGSAADTSSPNDIARGEGNQLLSQAVPG